jgi:hypothetical protein
MSGFRKKGADVNERHDRHPSLWFAAMLLALVGALAPAACGSTGSSLPSSPSTTPTPVVDGASPVAGDTVDFTENPLGRRTSWGESQEITDLYARVETPVERPEAPTRAPGMKIVVAEVTLENDSGERRRYAAGTFTAFDQEGHSYGPSRATSEALSSGRLGPDEALWGVLVFEVRRSATVERIVWTFPAFEWVNEWTWE